MSFRDDHDAALMRADAAEREQKVLAAENERLAAELAAAREWLGGPSKRAFLFGGILILGIGLVLVGVVIGRRTVDEPAVVAAAAPREPRLPLVYGVVVGTGPDVGHWTFAATRCAPRGDGVELTNIGSAGISIWMTNDQVELELPSRTLFLTKKQCITKLVSALTRKDDLIDGYVELDCSFDTNNLQGRIEFKHCR